MALWILHPVLVGRRGPQYPHRGQIGPPPPAKLVLSSQFDLHLFSTTRVRPEIIHRHQPSLDRADSVPPGHCVGCRHACRRLGFRNGIAEEEVEPRRAETELGPDDGSSGGSSRSVAGLLCKLANDVGTELQFQGN